MDIFATIFASSVPQNGLTDDPEIQITDDAGTIVQTFVAMTDLVVDGKYVRAFTIPDVARSYTFIVDADPSATAQVPSADRYYFGAFPGEADIIAVSTDLANLDVAVSTRNATTPLAAATDQAEHDATQAAIAAQVVPLDAATDQAEHDATQAAIAAQVVPMDAATSQAEHDATQAAIGALNDLSIADVQTALTNQGYTAARALLLDNLDAAISSRNAVTPMTAATSQAEHDATQVGIGLNLAAIAALNDISVGDILSAVLSSGNTVDAELSAVLALRDFIEGGRDIDFVGSDVLGWQRIERSVAGGLLRRYNLFDEAGARINETVPSFIARQGMISSEVAI